MKTNNQGQKQETDQYVYQYIAEYQIEADSYLEIEYLSTLPVKIWRLPELDGPHDQGNEQMTKWHSDIAAQASQVHPCCIGTFAI